MCDLCLFACVTRIPLAMSRQPGSGHCLVFLYVQPSGIRVCRNEDKPVLNIIMNSNILLTYLMGCWLVVDSRDFRFLYVHVLVELLV